MRPAARAGSDRSTDLSRRLLLQALAGALPALRLARAAGAQEIAEGPFQPTRESLRGYKIPEWFRDAKFGIWAHWGPQSAAEHGDWYARNMYIQGEEQYRYHVERYGHPTRFGFKDVIATWRAEEFDPRRLARLYKAAGARYLVSMGVHHDNFDLWDSKHTRWNAVNMGPRKDIVGLFRQAALDEGLRFGVSDHLWITYKWFSVSRGSDPQGPLAGVPYDGANPAYADLYADCPRVHTQLDWNEDGIPEAWKAHWFRRIKDLVDRYQPDFLYSDGHIPFGDTGLALVAHLYNSDARRRGGRVEAVYTSKRAEDAEVGTCALDVERGVVDRIWPRPWETGTCVGNWHYRRGVAYKSPKTVIDMLVDVVSRNGNLLLNFPLTSSGRLDEQEEALLREITAWMAVNAEAIHGTRPYVVFGDGPTTHVAPPAEAKFNEERRQELSAEDIRFTTRGDVLYAFSMGWAGKRVSIPALAPGGSRRVGRIRHVELLGAPGRLRFDQNAQGLTVELPPERPCSHAVCFKLIGAIAEPART